MQKDISIKATAKLEIDCLWSLEFGAVAKFLVGESVSKHSVIGMCCADLTEQFYCIKRPVRFPALQESISPSLAAQTILLASPSGPALSGLFPLACTLVLPLAFPLALPSQASRPDIRLRRPPLTP
jgi:hypothetical protein